MQDYGVINGCDQGQSSKQDYFHNEGSGVPGAIGHREMRSYWNEWTDSCGALRGGDGSRYSRSRFRVLQKPILGTADSEYWHCLGIRSFLLAIPQAFMMPWKWTAITEIINWNRKMRRARLPLHTSN